MKQDNAGVYIPPPLIYAAIFLISILIQNIFPLSKLFFETSAARIAGWILIITGLVFDLPAVFRFFRTKNTLITIKPANSLQVSGIYSFTRNPMYLGLLFLYSGIGLLAGSWWTFILIPLLIVVISNYVIKGEENYLERTFGQSFLDYKIKVRRWI